MKIAYRPPLGTATTRRTFLEGNAALALATLAAGSLAGCDALSTDPSGGEDGAGSAGKGAEAPGLADRVRAGELPPVAKRLPPEPLVVEPTEQVGTYGGTWRTAILGAADTYWINVTTGYEGLVRWKPDMEQFREDEIVPNMAKDFEVNADTTEFTFHLREGIKWSDGTPFTADDVLFWAEDVFGDKELSPVVALWFQADGEPVSVEKLDDLTVVFRFAAPSALFVPNLATGRALAPTSFPRHYLEKFHRKYNPDIEALVAEEGFSDWVELFFAKADVFANADRPVLNAWLITSPVGEATRVVAERNPYYWKTDPGGSQLPYLDEVVFDVVEDAEVMLLSAMNGEIDLQNRHIADSRNKPVLAQHRESGGYHFFDTVPDGMNTAVIALNLAHPDARVREVFQNKDFRVALSHAIDRDEIIELVFVSQGEPWQAAPRPESDYHDAEFAKQYTEYDPDRANELLDQILPDRDDRGRRLWPDGKPFTFAITVTDVPAIPYATDAMEIVREQWAKVGITVTVDGLERSLFYARKDANEHDATAWAGDGGLAVELEPRWYLPFSTESNFAISWAQWFQSNGAEGEEPVAAARQQMELYRELQATPDPEGRAELMQEILRIAKDEFWVIGVSLMPPGYGIVRDNMRNVPQRMVDAALFQNPGPTNPAQYFVSAE